MVTLLTRPTIALCFRHAAHKNALETTQKLIFARQGCTDIAAAVFVVAVSIVVAVVVAVAVCC